MFKTVQIIFGILGILFVLGNDRLKMPVLMYGGIICFGLVAITIGWEAIITREFQLGSRRRGTRETYTGIPAVLQGIQFNLIGLFLIGMSVAIYFNDQRVGRDVFLQFVRRPGIPLVVVGLLFLMQAGIVLIGFRELRQGPGWVVTMNLLISRMLPGLILVALGLGALGLGLFEIVSPNAFDEMGGGFLEMLYDVGE
jgi:hypothetical protein